jgi:ABC-type branched-subunit amino acid transport system ATPase component
MSASEAAPPVLEVRGLRKAFGGNVVLEDVNLQFQARRVSALIGPNGAGKTTCFNLLTGVLVPDRGEIRTGRTSRACHDRRRLGMCRSFRS